jgi:hypothetical protein
MTGGKAGARRLCGRMAPLSPRFSTSPLVSAPEEYLKRFCQPAEVTGRMG